MKEAAVQEPTRERDPGSVSRRWRRGWKLIVDKFVEIHQRLPTTSSPWARFRESANLLLNLTATYRKKHLAALPDPGTLTRSTLAHQRATHLPEKKSTGICETWSMAHGAPRFPSCSGTLGAQQLGWRRWQ